MAVALKLERQWTADEFVCADQSDFGLLWRYELVDGQVVGHAAPSPEHGAIIIGLGSALHRALRGKAPGCRPEAGSAATPRTEQRNTARIPDVMVRCGDLPRVAFEVVSPSELRSMRVRDLKRKHLQAVEGLAEIVEIFQDDYACHVYRREESGRWTFEALDGADAVLRLESVGVEVLLAEIYELAPPPELEHGTAEA